MIRDTDTRTSFSFLFFMKNTLPGMLSAERSWEPPIIEWRRREGERCQRREERRGEGRGDERGEVSKEEDGSRRE